MATTNYSKRQERREAMFALIEQYLQDPTLSQRTFCAQRQIDYSTFNYYLGKRRREQIPADANPIGKFIPLTLPDLSLLDRDHFTCEITWPNGVVVRFKIQPSPDYLLALIHAGNSGQ